MSSEKKTIRQLLAGRTQTWLASKIGVNGNSVSMWNNKKQRPSDKYLLLMANIFNVDADCIDVREESERKPKLIYSTMEQARYNSGYKTGYRQGIRQATTPWRKGSEWTEADGRVLTYDPYFSGPAAQPTYGYTVRRCINPSWHWMPLPQPPQGDE